MSLKSEFLWGTYIFRPLYFGLRSEFYLRFCRYRACSWYLLYMVMDGNIHYITDTELYKLLLSAYASGNFSMKRIALRFQNEPNWWLKLISCGRFIILQVERLDREGHCVRYIIAVCQVSPSADIFTLLSLVPLSSLQHLSMAPVSHSNVFLDIRNTSWALSVPLPWKRNILS